MSNWQLAGSADNLNKVTSLTDWSTCSHDCICKSTVRSFSSIRPQALIRQTKELRGKEISGKDRVANLKLELEEAKERKKVGIAEREQIRKGRLKPQ